MSQIWSIVQNVCFVLSQDADSPSITDEFSIPTSPEKAMTLTMTRMYSTTPNFQNRYESEFFAFWKGELEKMSSTHILHWAVDNFYPRLVLKTAFEPEGCVILSLLSKIVPEITVFCHEIDYQTQQFWNITGRFYRKTGLEIVPIHSLRSKDDSGRFDAMLDCTRRKERPGIRVLTMDPATSIPTISPLVRWTRDAIDKKLKQDAILDTSFLHVWPEEDSRVLNEKHWINESIK